MLEKIKDPKDLKNLSIQEKKILCEDIRKYILETVSKNGGHLASNLGIVELTVALESLLDMPNDKIIWDVGHQSYVHKLLTGRYEDFKNIRKLDNISGFPKTSESIYDTFNTGHSSTSISAALGIAIANKLNNKKDKTIAIIGDGALTGGMAYEGLVNSGTSKANILVIINDNNMSISKNIGGINKFLSKIRTRKHYVTTNNKVKTFTSKLPIIGPNIIKICHNIKWSIKRLVIPKMFFEDIGFKYFGVVDGHNLEELDEMLKLCLNTDGPIILHVNTKKGKGYEIAEKSPEAFHSTSTFDLETGKPKSKKDADYSSVFGSKLLSLAQKNDKIIAISAAMKTGTGLSNFSKTYPDRFIDTGIAEQHAITFAGGLAISGFIPVVNIYSSFYQRCYDQVVHDIAMQNLGVIMCVDRAGIVGNDGETHQGLLDMAMFNSVPNLNICSPSSFCELENMLDFAVNLKKPIIIRFPRGSQNKLAISILEKEYEKQEEIQLGKFSILSKKENISNNSNINNNNNNNNNKTKHKSTKNNLLIIAIGKKVQDAILAEKFLNKIGINTQIIDIRFLKPLDKNIIEYIKNYDNILTIEDGYIKNGLSSSINELIAKNKLQKNILNIGYDDVFVEHGSVDQLEKRYKTSYKDIIKSSINEFDFDLNNIKVDDEILNKYYEDLNKTYDR